MKKVTLLVFAIIAISTATSAGTKKTIKINYVKDVRNYTHIGLTISHKGFITCNSLRHGKIISTNEFYVDTVNEDVMYRKDRGTKVQCFYNN